MTIVYNYRYSDENENSISSDVVKDVVMDSKGILWIATGQGLCSYDYENNVFKKYKKKPYENDGLIEDKTRCLFIDSSGLIWVGQYSGISIFNPTSNFYNYKSNPNNSNSLSENIITELYEDDKKVLWVGTSEEGIDIINYILDDMGIDDKSIRAVYEDSKGNYYLGCFLNGGLIKINTVTKEYKIYKNDEYNSDSISSNIVIYISEDLDGNILVDKNNEIWMSTNGGISKFSLKDESFKNFTVEDGLTSNEFNGRACFSGKEGYMYFGSMNGLSVIDVDNIELSTFKPRVIFDNFEVNGIIKKHIDNKKFKYNENNIRVNFFTDDYKMINSLKYYYRLSGLEQEWHTINGNSLIFANLAPGNYKLEIKTMTNHGVMSEVNSVNFTIKTPFWNSKAAIVIYCVLIASAIYIQMSKVKRLDKLVNKSTKELREEMKKNEQLYNHVIELEQAKNNYFVNLSHELRTPLNILMSTNQLIDSLSNDSVLLTKEKISHYVNIMNRNCNRLLSLINNLIDYVKLENNVYLITKERVDIVSLVEDTVFDMKDYIEENGIQFIFDTDIEEKIINI